MAWSILKSRPVSPAGKEYSPEELQALRSFVHANIESPDPQLQAKAQELMEEITTAMSFASGRTPFNTPTEPQERVSAGAAPAVPGVGGPAARVGVSPPLPQERESNVQ